MERAGRAGAFKALEERIKTRRQQLQNEVTDPLAMCGWLMSIPEMATFVNAYLDAAHAEASTETVRQARGLAQGFGAGDASGATATLMLSSNLAGACEIMRIVLVVFDQPLKAVGAQFDRTIGTDDGVTPGTGTHDLHRGIDRVSFAARYTRAALQADEIPVKATPIRTAAEAVAASSGTSGIAQLASLMASRSGGGGAAYSYWSNGEYLSGVQPGSNYQLLRPDQQAVIRDAMLGNLTSNEHSLRDGLRSGAIQASLRSNQMNEQTWATVLQQARDEADLSPEAVFEVNQALAEFAPQLADVGPPPLVEAPEASVVDPQASEPLLTVPQAPPEDQEPTTLEEANDALMAALRSRRETDANALVNEYARLFIAVNAYKLTPEGGRIDWSLLPTSGALILAANEVLSLDDPSRAATALSNVWPKWQQAEPNVPDRDFRGIHGPRETETLVPEVPNPAREQGLLGGDTAPRDGRAAPGSGNTAGGRTPNVDKNVLLPVLAAGGVVVAYAALNALRQKAVSVLGGFGKAPGEGRRSFTRVPVPAPDPDALPPLVVAVGPTEDYCATKTLDEALASTQQTLNGLCGAITQLREDGGFAHGPDRQVLRNGGVSPFWDALYRPLVRDQPDEWGMRLWPDSVRRNATFNDVGTDLQGLAGRFQAMVPSPSGDPTRASAALLQTKGDRCLLYCLVRGLTRERPPHEVVPPGSTLMRYNTPMTAFDSTFALKYADQKPLPSSPAENAIARLAFSNVAATTRPAPDLAYAVGSPSVPTADTVGVSKWAPVSVAPVRSIDYVGTQTGYRVDASAQNKAVAEAVVYEKMVDNYKAFGRSTNPDKARFGLACAAAAKVAQLPSMVTVFNTGDLRGLCKPFPLSDGDTDQHMFVTRPVMRCPGGDVLYPCDAGLAHMVIKQAPVKRGLPTVFEQTLPPDRAWGTVTGNARSSDLRATMTSYMRAVVAGPRGPAPPLYVARAVGDTVIEMKDPRGFLTQRNTQQPSVGALPTDPDLVGVNVLLTILREGAVACDKLAQLDCEEEAVKSMQAQDAAAPTSGPSDLDDIARVRRDAVWDDALREACISGDRLYAFVRQLSGTISENVDAVCQIDEGMLVRQQAQVRERRTRASEQAAREHMQLVRNVFASVLRES